MTLAAMLRRAPRALANAARDLRYGAFLGGTWEARHPGAVAGNVDYEDLPPLFAAAAVRPGETIVDVGAGKGRAINWLVGRYPGNPIVGIEIDPELAERTARRLARFANVTVLAGDATSLLPADAAVLYLFNPFGEDAVRRLASAVLAGGAAGRRIVYHNCKHVHVFRDDPRFEVREIELPSRRFPAALVTLRG